MDKKRTGDRNLDAKKKAAEKAVDSKLENAFYLPDVKLELGAGDYNEYFKTVRGVLGSYTKPVISLDGSNSITGTVVLNEQLLSLVDYMVKMVNVPALAAGLLEVAETDQDKPEFQKASLGIFKKDSKVEITGAFFTTFRKMIENSIDSESAEVMGKELATVPRKMLPLLQLYNHLYNAYHVRFVSEGKTLTKEAFLEQINKKEQPIEEQAI
jgi:hypothetical protein